MTFDWTCFRRISHSINIRFRLCRLRRCRFIKTCNRYGRNSKRKKKRNDFDKRIFEFQFINDRPIRIDVAVRPLGATKNEGFRNKCKISIRNDFISSINHCLLADFESHDNRRPPLRNNNNRSYDGYRQNVRSSNSETFDNRTRQASGSNQLIEQKTPERKISNDDVFIAPDTPNSIENEHEQTTNGQEEQTFARQHSRNWADCPIDETVNEPSPPPSANENFQVTRRII